MWIETLDQYAFHQTQGLNRIHSHWVQVQTVTGRIISISPVRFLFVFFFLPIFLFMFLIISIFDILYRQNLQSLPKNELFLRLTDDRDEEISFFEDSEETTNGFDSNSSLEGLRINVRNAFCSRPG
jgi:hypothetical protein